MYNPKVSNNNILITLQTAEQVVKIGCALLDYVRKNKPRICDNTYKNISQLLLQMAVVKLQSLHQLASTPLNLIANETIKIPYVDPISLACIERTLYELLVMHHFLFIENKTVGQKEFAIKLWKILGLSNRLNMDVVIPAIYQSQFDSDSFSVATLKEEVLSSRFYTHTDDRGKKRIKEVFKQLKPLLVLEQYEDVEIHIESFESAWKFLYPNINKNNVVKFLYKQMSFQSHPSYLGILQFGQQGNAETCYRSTIVKGAIHFCSKLYKEVAEVIPELKVLLSKLDYANFKMISIFGNDKINELNSYLLSNGKSKTFYQVGRR